jgi:transposase
LGRSELLAPLVEALRKYVLSASKIHADDTPVPVLAPGNGKTRTGRLWTNVRDERPAGENTPPAAWFAYIPDRKGEHPRQHLKNFKGALQADAYAGFHHLYGRGEIYQVACWAHSLRKFHDRHAIHASRITTEAIARIGALYGIEEDVRGTPTALRCSVRQTRAKPLLDDLRSAAFRSHSERVIRPALAAALTACISEELSRVAKVSMRNTLDPIRVIY